MLGKGIDGMERGDGGLFGIRRERQEMVQGYVVKVFIFGGYFFF